jgi:uncharacterized protein YjbI with pentapeptide repeats
VAAPPQRWRTPLIVGLAAAAGLGVGVALPRRGLAGLALVAGILLLVALVAWWVFAWVVMEPRRLAPPVPAQELDQFTTKARLEAADARLRLYHDLRNGAVQALAVVAVIVGAAVGFAQLAEDRGDARADRELTRQGQASERFTRAITQLGDQERVETRIGGIYGLAQVAEQAPDNNRPVGEVLLAYLNHLKRPKPPPTTALSEHAPDVQAALTVLTQYDKDRDGTKDYGWLSDRLDLHALGLYGVDLGGAALTGAVLREAVLRFAVLRGADLHYAALTGADLRFADLHGADISQADLHGVNLGGADLSDAILSHTDISQADLYHADLGGADLSDTNLGGTDLTDTILTEADLRGANLHHAVLGDAILSDTFLNGATANDQTQWPDGFDWRGAGVKSA